MSANTHPLTNIVDERLVDYCGKNYGDYRQMRVSPSGDVFYWEFVVPGSGQEQSLESP